MDDVSMTWYEFTHPDAEAMEKRDEFMESITAEKVKFTGDGIYAEINLNWEFDA